MLQIILSLFIGLLSFSLQADPIAQGISYKIQLKGAGYLPFQYSDHVNVFMRAAEVQQDINQDLVLKSAGYKLLAYDANSNSQPSHILRTVNLGEKVNLLGKATQNLSLSLNLNASETIHSSAFDGRSFESAELTSHYSIYLTAYDSLGNERPVTIYFRKLGWNEWNFHVLTLGKNLNNYRGEAHGTVILAEGSLTFLPTGRLERLMRTLDGIEGDVIEGQKILENDENGIQWMDAERVSSLNIDFSGAGHTTQYAGESSANYISQDGRTQGELISIEFDSQGTLIGNYSNGISKALYFISLAMFLGERFLYEFSPGIFAGTQLSGQAEYGMPGENGRAEIAWSYEGGQEPIETNP